MSSPPPAFAIRPEAASSRSKLAMLTTFALAASAVPLPFVPDRIISRIRGAIAHDVLARSGLSLTSDARTLLAEPDGPGRGRVLIRRAADVLTTSILKRLGPIGVVTTAIRALEVYAFGHLLERYVTRVRRTAAVRVHDAEARKLREAIDRAVVRALSPSLRAEGQTLDAGAEDLRDEFTRWVDVALLASASLPSYIDRRLDAAFDDIVTQTPGLGDD